MERPPFASDGPIVPELSPLRAVRRDPWHLECKGLRRTLWNLATNAIEYGAPETRSPSQSSGPTVVSKRTLVHGCAEAHGGRVRLTGMPVRISRGATSSPRCT